MVCVVYFIGVILYSGWLGWTWYKDGYLPDLPWWQHLLAPLGVVAAWLGMEILGIYVANGFVLEEARASKWRHMLGVIGIFLLLAAIVIGMPLYELSKA